MEDVQIDEILEKLYNQTCPSDGKQNYLLYTKSEEDVKNSLKMEV